MIFYSIQAKNKALPVRNFISILYASKTIFENYLEDCLKSPNMRLAFKKDGLFRRVFLKQRSKQLEVKFREGNRYTFGSFRLPKPDGGNFTSICFPIFWCCLLYGMAPCHTIVDWKTKIQVHRLGFIYLNGKE